MDKWYVSMARIMRTLLLIAAGALYLKGCIGTGATFESAQYYRREGPGGSTVYMALVPPRSVVLVKELGDAQDAALYKMYGSELMNIVGDLYNIGTTPFGLRYYSGARKVVDAGLTIVDKQSYKCEKTSYDDVGSTYSTIMVMYDNAFTTDGDEYIRTASSVDIALLDRWIERLHAEKP